MSIRVLRKALGLLIVDIVIIIGIFVLQFRTDSNIIEKIDNLQFTFIRAEGATDSNAVKNKLNATYNGINFFCDDQHPAVIIDSKGASHPVELISWSRPDDLSCKLDFTENVSITFELASLDANASLAIVSELPADVQTFAIPYNYSSNMKVDKDDGNRVVLNGRKNFWEFTADSLESGYLGFSSHNYIATYGIYEETEKFTFDSIVNLAIADSSVYKQNVETLKKNLIAAFKSNNQESNLTEKIAVSYVAAQASDGNYASAIEDVPSSIKKSKQRTYISTPYFNSLEDMNATLDKTIKEYEKKIAEAVSSNSLDIFTVQNIASFMYINSNTEAVKKLLQSTTYYEAEQISIAQSVGILNVFTEMSSLNSEYAKLLLPAVDKCIQRITDACSFEGNILTISDNDTFLSVIQAVETGVALVRYGILTNNITLQKAGYVLVNSYMAESSSFDLRTLSNLYPILAYDNWYYPHFKKITGDKGNDLWAWTCAEDIIWERDDSKTAYINVVFPEGLTHYVIIKNVPSFTTIFIYNMAFRTDPRFETYNSSGYVYKQNTKTLLLKSRHKARVESVKFDYSIVEKKPEPVKETPAKAVVEEVKETPVAVEPETTAPVETAPAEETTPAPVAEETPAVQEPAVEETKTETTNKRKKK